SFTCRLHRSPRSTLFPYTTLFRSGAGRGAQASPHRLRRRIRRLRRRQHQEGVSATAARVGFTPGEVTPYTLRHTAATWMAQVGRSEEHTSELQSRENLVCRLLLEK